MNELSPSAEAERAQRRASDPAQSVWVGASAGTGKTKVLTDRVLSLLLAGTPPYKILCLTFTRAAAAEMANRINRSLSQWAIADYPSLVKDIAELTGTAPEEEMLARARILFRSVLETPGGMKIQTLHSFCESLLGRFPLEAGLAPHFSAMDEREAQEAHAEARARILSVAGTDAGPLATALSRLAGLLDETRFADIMSSLSSERGRLERISERFGGLDGAIAETCRRMGVEREESREAIIAAACADAAFDGVPLRAAAELMLAGTTKTDRGQGARLADWLAAGSEARAASFDSYRSVFFTAKGDIRANICTQKLGEAHPDCREALEKEAARLSAVIERLHALATAEATAALLTVAAALNDAYEDWKRRHGRLDYDDLVLKARRLLESDGGASWVLFKLDGGIDHILIDEAQDTNPDQWAVVAALAEEFFAGAGARDLNRTVFAVGDAKQSIYSFQRADPAAFESMRGHFRERVAGVGRSWDDVSLEVSFRSTAPVLSLVDAVFAEAPASDGVVDGDGLRHIAYRAGQGGCVEMWPLIAPETQEEAPWTPPVTRRGDLQPSVRLARTIAAQIDRWVTDEEILESQGRPIRPGDILVLVRRRVGFVDQLVRELKARGIPVAGVDRMLLGEQLAVRDLLALGEFLLLPDDDLTLAIVLKGPLFGFDDDDLFDLTRDRGKTSLWQVLQDKAGADPRYQAAREELSSFLARVDFVPPFELFADVLTKREGRKQIVSRLGHDALDPIDEFMARALSYEQGRPASLQGFIQTVLTDTEDVKRDLDEGQRDEVRIMTVHGSKGLQAPIVFMPDTVAKPQRPTGFFWTDDDFPLWPPVAENAVSAAADARNAAIRKQEQEYRRLLYVALTRAEDRLYICGWETRKKPEAGNWYELVEKALAGAAMDMDLTALSPAGWDGTGYRLSVAQEAETEKPKTTGVVFGEAATPPDWARRPPPTEKSPPSPLIPSRPEEDEPATVSPVGGADAGRFKRGLIIHKLLQSLPEVAPARRDEAAKAFLARPVQGLEKAAQAEIAAEVLAILTNPEFAPLFSSGSRAEVPIAGRIGDTVISGQVDRLVVEEDRVLVVDYKSNRPPPGDSQSVPAIYLRQMAAYRAVLTRIWPGREVSCALLWTVGPHMMPLPDTLLDQWRPG